MLLPRISFIVSGSDSFAIGSDLMNIRLFIGTEINEYRTIGTEIEFLEVSSFRKKKLAHGVGSESIILESIVVPICNTKGPS